MLSHSQLKFLRSLQIGKFRAKEKLFLVEGEKLVKECLRRSYLPGFELIEIYALQEWINSNQELISQSGCISTSITPKQLGQVSSQKNPNQLIGLLRYSDSPQSLSPANNELYQATDHVQDPGNMGTIFRMAEWFGVKCIFLSNDSTDPYNTKVIQASMGSILRVPFLRGDLESTLEPFRDSIPIYGSMLEGRIFIKRKSLPEVSLFLVMNQKE